MFYSVLRPFLFALPPESAHSAVTLAARVFSHSRIACRLASRFGAFDDAKLSQTIQGMKFCNPIGLAAGFDKNGVAVPYLSSLGFGHIEVGSISARPSQGNSRPRLFRLTADEAILVNYGVPNQGAVKGARNLQYVRCQHPLGVNIVKTNDGMECSFDDILEDYANSWEHLASLSSYVTLNLSCPNAIGKDHFLEPDKIGRLLERLDRSTIRRPICLKINPLFDNVHIAELVAIANQFSDVFALSVNLTAQRNAHLDFKAPGAKELRHPGAISGPPCERLINEKICELFRAIPDKSRLRLIAAGGIRDAESAYRKIRCGASLLQLYTALIYRGPVVIREILSGLVQLLERDRLHHLGDAIGLDC